MISCAVEDWHYFFAQHGPIETAINLPISFLQEPDSVVRLCQQLPNHTAFEGLIVEIDGTEIVRNLSLAKDVASRLRLHKIAISIDDLGAEWLSLTGLRNFPFVEIKVDQKFVTGCAEDCLKQSICRRILDLAAGYGARTVAEGVETWADFLAVRDMCFDLAQGFLFAKPMSAQKFAQTCWAGPQACLPPLRSASTGELELTSRPARSLISMVGRFVFASVRVRNELRRRYGRRSHARRPTCLSAWPRARRNPACRRPAQAGLSAPAARLRPRTACRYIA